MKRYLLAILLMVIILGILALYMPKPLSKVMNYPKDTQCEIFCKSTNLPATNVGFGYLVCCSYQTLLTTLELCGNVDGVTLRFFATERDLQSICDLLQLKVYSCQYFCDVMVICGYSQKVSGGIFVDNKKTNVQIAFYDGVLTIGSPLILGSY